LVLQEKLYEIIASVPWDLGFHIYVFFYEAHHLL